MTLFENLMPHGGWVACSVVASVFSAAIYLINQYFKVRGDHLVFWMRVMTVLALAPFAQAMGLPRDPHFYVAVILTVAAAIGADIRTFDVSAKYGAGVVSRVQPFLVWASFLLWFLFDPSLFARYAARPVNTALILLCLSGCVWFARRQSKCPVSRAALLEMLPALAGYAAVGVFNKYAMMHGTLESAAFGYMFVQSALSIPPLGIWLMHKERQILPSKIKIIWRTRATFTAAALMTLCWIGHMSFKNVAMAFTPNPAYILAIGQTTPVFIALFYLAVGHKEEADVRSGMGVVACAALLAIVTAL